ncbi:PREDICTED: uncharacterized protein LOC109347006 [Lupinus angustifolius]|uniref:uncharacterized protein LOC109347006 n=1 Tax=Lupinus angustifolius TaxID=3871 RepID=UPI00092E5A4A|nr:PREDICTED: uncharacterized protein LOC109347006 [Lupinus angustifolius]
MLGRRGRSRVVGSQELTLETLPDMPSVSHQPTCQHGRQTAERLPNQPQAKRQDSAEYGPGGPPATEKAALDNTLGRLRATLPAKSPKSTLLPINRRKNIGAVCGTMVTTRNRALSTSQVDPAPSTLPPPRQPSHQASRSHHITPEQQPTTQHLLQMLERQERLIQQQADVIQELRQSKITLAITRSALFTKVTVKSQRASPTYHPNQSRTTPAYDGTADPQDHLDAFEASMLFHGATDPIMCRAFPLTLKKAALQWFTRLAPNSINTWETLALAFNTRFTASKEQPRLSYTLPGIRQGPNESIRAYLDRFNTEAMKVRTLSPEVMVHVLVMGLQEGLFRTELAKYTDLTMEDLCSKAQQFINLEETHYIHTHTEPQMHHPSREAKRPRLHDHPHDLPSLPKKAKYSTYTPLNASRSRILQEVLSTHLVQLPRPRPTKPGPQDRSKYCDYHSMFGHLTNDCTQLRDTIEDLIQAGHLQQFIAGLEQRRRSPQHRRPESSKRRSPPHFQQRRPTPRPQTDRHRADNRRPRSPVDINTISGGFAAGGTSRAAQKKYVREVMHVAARSSQQRQSYRSVPPITFDDHDYEGVIRGHDDPLVITAMLNNKKVSRLFIDQGSSTDIIFQDLFEKMELHDRDLLPYDGQLVGFFGQGITPRGERGSALSAQLLPDEPLPPLQQTACPPSKRPRGMHMVELDVRADEGDFRPQPEGEKTTLQLGQSSG